MAGFRVRRHYGFELVDVERGPRIAPQFRVNRKFTANQVVSIFHDFSAN
jgi:hypothetical protein